MSKLEKHGSSLPTPARLRLRCGRTPPRRGVDKLELKIGVLDLAQRRRRGTVEVVILPPSPDGGVGVFGFAVLAAVPDFLW